MTTARIYYLVKVILAVLSTRHVILKAISPITLPTMLPISLSIYLNVGKQDH